MSKFSALSDGEVTEFKRVLASVGFTAELVRHINQNPSIAAAMLVTAEGAAKTPPVDSGLNPFALTVDEQLDALRKQNELGLWGLPDEVFTRLKETAPEWPEGKEAFRSFRIRFGEGSEGVALTFERHAEAMKRVHAKFRRWELLHSQPTPVNGKGKAVERLRLLNGNDSHHAVVEWVIIPDLSVHRQRESVTSVRSTQSLADEGLVITWLFPKRAEAIDYEKYPAWFCAGYEASVPECGDEGWRDVVIVYRNLDTGGVVLFADWHSNGYSGYSVPLLRE